MKQGWWTKEEEEAQIASDRASIIAMIQNGEAQPKHPPESILEDVYNVMPQHLEKQQEELIRLVKLKENSTEGCD